MNEQLLSYVKAYRTYLGLMPLPSIDETTVLLVSKKDRRPLKIRQLYSLVKAIGTIAAKAFENQPLKKKKLEHLSPHWLRHLSASHQNKVGIPLMVIQANLRQSSQRILQIYVHSEDELRAAESEKLRMDIEPQLMTRVTTAQKVELKLKIKGSSVSGRLNLSRLLESIEKAIFKRCDWERKERDTEDLLDRYEHLKKVGSALEFSYYLRSLEENQLRNIKQAIIREASIRLFDCEFKEIQLLE